MKKVPASCWSVKAGNMFEKMTNSGNCVYVVQQFVQSTPYMQQERLQPMEQEQQIMILLDGLEQNEDDQDLLERLVAETSYTKKGSFNYDYQPAPLFHPDIEEAQDTNELKTSNRSTSTCADSEAPVRRCFCTKTRCQKNYCECFKLGLACTADCECLACGNKERLFLSRTSKEITKCKCQKSHCLKKYCQCHSSGRKCGPACKCLQCQNIEQPMFDEQPHHHCSQIDPVLFFNI